MQSAVIRPVRNLALVHLAANALWLWLGYYWLGLGETRAATLAWSALIALVTAGLVCCTYGAAFAFFQIEDAARAATAWKTALRNLLPLALAVAAAIGIYYLLSLWDGYSTKPASTIASYLTLKLRKPVRPSSVLRVFHVALWLVRWVAMPVLLLPALAAVSSRGWHGFGHMGRRAWHALYWIETPLLLLCALWVPSKLLGWIPYVSSFGLEALSFTLRALLAYLLFTAAWLALAFVTSDGMPRLTQSKTAASP